MNTQLLTTHVPLDKSWMIRMGILDLRNGMETTINFLEKLSGLSEDLEALCRASRLWKKSDEIDIGESGTLFRFLQFLSWKEKLGKNFVRHGTLKTRKITTDENIVNYSIEQLLTLDNNTSQWASAAVLCGNTEPRPENLPFKLALTYEAVAHWQERHDAGEVWKPRYDETISEQATVFLKLLKGESVVFVPKQAEDYCFARAFWFISAEEGLHRWPSLLGHESNRIEEMEHMINEVKLGNLICSNDHRVVQALAMYAAVCKKNLFFKNPSCVSKSWPQFWDFMKQATQ